MIVHAPYVCPVASLTTTTISPYTDVYFSVPTSVQVAGTSSARVHTVVSVNTGTSTSSVSPYLHVWVALPASVFVGSTTKVHAPYSCSAFAIVTTTVPYSEVNVLLPVVVQVASTLLETVQVSVSDNFGITTSTTSPHSQVFDAEPPTSMVGSFVIVHAP